MQEISYSDVKLSKDSEDMRTALVWMDVERYTLVVCVGNLTFVFWSCFRFIFLSLIFSFFIFSFNSWTVFSIFLCNSKIFCVNNLDLSPLTDSYFSNILLPHLLLFEMAHFSFLFQNMILGMTNIKTMCSGMWPLEDM